MSFISHFVDQSLGFILCTAVGKKYFISHTPVNDGRMVAVHTDHCLQRIQTALDVCDIAGYNGDGGKFQNNNKPNVVAEYGSKVQDRPGEYRPFYDQIQGSSSTEYKLQKNSAGLSLWCAFHHGTIGGNGLAKMGIIDYYRLPTNSWYWYREKNTGVAPEASQDGTAAKMELTTSDT